MEIDKSKTLEEQFKNKIYPVLLGRDQKFPEGESPNDLQARAEQAIEELIIPHVWKSTREGHESVHIAVVSHGLCISELVAALMHKGVTERSGEGNKWKGLLNTAWTRAVIEVQVSLSLRTTSGNLIRKAGATAWSEVGGEHPRLTSSEGARDRFQQS